MKKLTDYSERNQLKVVCLYRMYKEPFYKWYQVKDDSKTDITINITSHDENIEIFLECFLMLSQCLKNKKPIVNIFAKSVDDEKAWEGYFAKLPAIKDFFTCNGIEAKYEKDYGSYGSINVVPFKNPQEEPLKKYFYDNGRQIINNQYETFSEYDLIDWYNKNVNDNDFERINNMAFNSHIAWYGTLNTNLEAAEEELCEKETNYLSSLSFAVSLGYKLVSLGCVDADEYPTDDYNMDKVIKKTREKIISLKKTEKNELLETEHRRWVTEYVCSGWKRRELKDISADDNANKSVLTSVCWEYKQHLCIAPCRANTNLDKWKLERWIEQNNYILSGLDELDELDKASVVRFRNFYKDATANKQKLLQEITRFRNTELDEITDVVDKHYVEDWLNCAELIAKSDFSSGAVTYRLATERIDNINLDNELIKGYIELIKKMSKYGFEATKRLDYKTYDINYIDNISFILSNNRDIRLSADFDYVREGTSYDDARAWTVDYNKLYRYVSLVKKVHPKELNLICNINDDNFEKAILYLDNWFDICGIKKNKYSPEINAYCNGTFTGKLNVIKVQALSNKPNDCCIKVFFGGNHTKYDGSCAVFDSFNCSFTDEKSTTQLLPITFPVKNNIRDVLTISKTEFSKGNNAVDDLGLMKLFLESPGVWNILCTKIGEYLKKGAKVTFPRKKPGVDSTSIINVRLDDVYTFERLLAFLKAYGIISNYSYDYIAEMNIRQYLINSNYQTKIDKLSNFSFKNVYYFYDNKNNKDDVIVCDGSLDIKDLRLSRAYISQSDYLNIKQTIKVEINSNLQTNFEALLNALQKEVIDVNNGNINILESYKIVKRKQLKNKSEILYYEIDTHFSKKITEIMEFNFKNTTYSVKKLDNTVYVIQDEIKDLLRKLEFKNMNSLFLGRGFLNNLSFDKDYISASFSFLSPECRDILSKGGNAFEMWVYKTLINSNKFDDYISGNEVYWKNSYYNNGKETTNDRKNEIDCLLVKDSKTIFLELKACKKLEDDFYSKLTEFSIGFGVNPINVIIIASSASENVYKTNIAKAKLNSAIYNVPTIYLDCNNKKAEYFYNGCDTVVKEVGKRIFDIINKPFSAL